MILILEDDFGKAARISLKYAEEIGHNDVIITAFPLTAEALLHKHGQSFEIVFLDYDLYPGAGNGLQFLQEHLTPACCGKVIFTTMNLDAREKMAKICKDRGLAYEQASMRL